MLTEEQFPQQEMPQEFVPPELMNGEMPMPPEMMAPQQPVQQEMPPEPDFYRNLALDMDSRGLSELASNLVTGIEDDLASREEWEESINTVLAYTGLKVEEFTDKPYIKACAAYDTNLLSAWLKFFSTARAELFPTQGPCRVQINGIADEQTEDQAQRVQLFMNYYLTKVDEDYYPDSERLLMYLSFFGCAFRKVYQDPVTGNPIARLVKPQDLIVNNDATSLMSSFRITQVLMISKEDIAQLERNGDFVPLGKSVYESNYDDNTEDESTTNKNIDRIEGIDKSVYETRSLFKFYEVHTYLSDEQLEELLLNLNTEEVELGEMFPIDINAGFDDGLEELPDLGFESADELNMLDAEEESPEAMIERFEQEVLSSPVASPVEEIVEEEELTPVLKPYVITIFPAANRIVAIKQNWNKEDIRFKRKTFFVEYPYIRGLGLYGLGLAHIMGSYAIALTALLRDGVNLTRLKTYPGGLRRPEVRVKETNNLGINLGEFVEVDTGGLSIQESFMPFPYGDLPPSFLQLRDTLKQEGMQAAGIAESVIAENMNNIQATVMLAAVEEASKSQSSVLRTAHVALGQELKLIYDLFGECLPEQPYPFLVPGKDAAIMKADFNGKLQITPAADASVLTHTQRIAKAQALMQLMQGAPQLYDAREVNKRLLKAIDIDNIEQVLPEAPKPVPLDAISENMNAMAGGALAVSLGQSHPAHIIDHKAFLNEMKSNPNPQMANPQAIVMLTKHIQLHEAAQIIQQQMQQQAEMAAQNGGQQMLLEQIQQQMQQQMNQVLEEQVLSDLNIQNALSDKAAQEIQQQIEQAQQQPPPIDPNQVLADGVEQQREAALLKDQQAKMENEMDRFKTETHVEIEMQKIELEKMKIEIQLQMAELKNMTSLRIAETKQINEEMYER